MLRVIRRSSLLHYSTALVLLCGALLFLWPGLLQNLFASDGFMTHYHCYAMLAPLVNLHYYSDLLIGLSYVAISLTLTYLVYRARRDIPFHWVFLAFGLFIIACGGTHFMEVWTTYHEPVYWLAGYVKLITAVASVATAIVLPPLVPKTLALVRAAKLSEQRRTELEAANEELSQLYRKVKELDDLKTQFFANVSHELRTPLTLLLGPAQRLLAHEQLSAPAQRDVELIERNARALLKQVNDLLDISKLEAGKMTVNYQATDLAKLARLTGAYFESFALERNISFDLAAPPTLAAEADPEKMQRVLLNLLSNAFKFTPDGGRVRCDLLTDSTGQRILVEVRDSGEGIAPEWREAIFERFQQAEGRAPRHSGTGLGLAIVKEFVELHGGHVSVGDAPEGGALFRIELPTHAPAGTNVQPAATTTTKAATPDAVSQTLGALENAQLAQAAATNTPEAAPASHMPTQTPIIRLALAPRVLVIEDNPEMSRFITEALRPAYRVLQAFDGATGIRLAVEAPPDLILCDVMMPGMTGEQVVEALRQHTELAGVPICMLTANANEAMRVRLLHAGVQDYLLKPFVSEELRVRVNNLIAAKHARELLQDDLSGLAHEIDLRRTEAATTAAALRETNQTLQAIIQASPLGIVVLDPEGIVKLWNSAAERIYGWSEQEVLNRPLPTIPEGQEEELRRNQNLAITGHNFTNYETRRRRKDGTLIDVSISTAPLRNVEGETTSVMALIEDVTERKRVAARLLQFAAIVENSNDAIISTTLDGTIQSWNPAAERLYGYTTEEVLGQAVTLLVPPSLPDEEPRILEQIRRGARVDHYETVRQRKDGSLVDISLTVSPVKDAQGQIVGASKIARDITERKRSEAALRQSEERNQALLDALPDLMFRFDRRGRFLDVHATNQADLLLPVSAFLGHDVREVMPPQIAEETLRYIERAATTRELQVFEYELAHPQGSRSYEARVVASGADEVIFIVRDITNRRQREAAQRFLGDATTALASSLDYKQTLQQVARLAVPYMADICQVDILDEETGAILHMAVVHSNPAMETRWREMQRRWPLDPAAPYTVPKVLRTGEPEIYPEVTEELARAFLTDEERIQTLLSFGIKSSMIVPLKARGRTLGAVTFLSTESAREYRTSDLALAEELARRAALAIDNARLYQHAQEANRAKDEFLATLSHELRTPLTPIIGWVHMLSSGQMGEAQLQRGLGVIDKNSQALARLINDLLDMSAIINGKMRIDRLPVTLDNVLREAVETVRPLAEARQIKIELSLCAEQTPLFVAGDRTRLGQVFWNLFNNAVKFSHDDGAVRIACQADAAEVRITVADEGIGITPEFLPRVFDRFRQADMSTTKTHAGLGIGLALVRSFVEAHGGTVAAESEGAGRGSRFIVRLPRMQMPTEPQAETARTTGNAANAPAVSARNAPAADAASAAAQTVAPARPTEAHGVERGPRLLLVEDAPDTLELLRFALTRRGYAVEACGTAEDALSIAAREHFDIIISDIGLPHIDGYELLARLRTEQPALRAVPAIALTGYAAAQDVERALAAGFAAHVAKPIDPAALAQVVEQMLAQPRASADGA